MENGKCEGRRKRPNRSSSHLPFTIFHLPSNRRLVVVSQTFVPDPASVGQHMADVAIELARRGHDVRVYASARGYENAAVRYPAREILRGVDVRRFPLASFGKKHILLRVLGTAMFHAQAFFATLLTPKLDGLKCLGEIPMIERTERCNPVFKHVIDQLPIVIEPGLVH